MSQSPNLNKDLAQPGATLRSAPSVESRGAEASHEGEAFTLVFAGNLSKFKGNPFKIDTPFGRPFAAGVGNVFDDLQNAEMEGESCDFVRAAAKRVTGGNCAFVDDDIGILEHLAQRAVEAGLTDRLHASVRASLSRVARTPSEDVRNARPQGAKAKPEHREEPNPTLTSETEKPE